MAYSLTDLLTSLAHSLGERSVNSTTSAPRTNFIQQTLAEAYQAYPWRFARTTATLAISNGIATLPSNYDDNHSPHVRFDNGSQIELDPVDPDDSEDLADGDRAYWIEAIDDTTYVLNTKDSDVSTISFRYQKQAPILDSGDTIKTPYPNKSTITLGARRYVKLGQNPDADISQDEKIFQNRLATDIASHQVPAPRKRRKTAHSQTGRYTGDF